MSGFVPSLVGTFLQSKHGRSDFLYGAGVGMTLFDHLNARVEYERISIKNATNSEAMWLTGAWRFYWRGGPSAARRAADQSLSSCVESRGTHCSHNSWMCASGSAAVGGFPCLGGGATVTRGRTARRHPGAPCSMAQR